MKKFVALLLCASMIFAFATPAVKAVEEESISVCAIFDEIDEVDSPNQQITK